jgi:signal transduction histidine kinase
VGKEFQRLAIELRTALSEQIERFRGLGLNRMEERLKLVKGSLSIDSLPKRGTTIHARVPLTPNMKPGG